MLPIAHRDNCFPLSTIKSSPASGDTNHYKTLCFPCLLNVFYCSISSTVCQGFFEQMLFSPWVWVKGQGGHEAARGTTSLYPDQSCHEMKPSNPLSFCQCFQSGMLHTCLKCFCSCTVGPVHLHLSNFFLPNVFLGHPQSKNMSACQGTCPLCPVDPDGWSQALELL